MGVARYEVAYAAAMVTIRHKREWYGRKGEVSTGVTLPQMTNFHDAGAQTVFCSVRDPGFRDW